MAAEFREEFRWPICTLGYQLIEGCFPDIPKPKPPTTVLTHGDLSVDQELLDYNWYAPMVEYLALFRAFAFTDKTNDGVLAFANRFGMLGSYHSKMALIEGAGELGVALAEPLTAWTENMAWMQQCVVLWDYLTSSDNAAIARFVHVENNSVVWRPDISLPTTPALETIVLADETESPERFQLLRRDMKAAAHAAIQLVTNRHLDNVRPRLEEDSHSGKWTLRYMPRSLIGALWYQFVVSMTEGYRYRVCRECGEWFMLPSRGGRLPREFCSNACRNRAYRDRQERARQMHADGKSPKEIAKEFNTSVKTIKGWIKKGK